MNLHFILDPSAFVYGGIGKLKKWGQLYETDQSQRSSLVLPNVLFHVPYYTLKELDFLKKVYNPLISSNARESIKFIDEQISHDDDDFNNHLSSISDDEDIGFIDSDNDEQIVVDSESYNRQHSIHIKSKIEKSERPHFKFLLEGTNEMGPPWRIASGYRHSTPSIKELPNYDENGKVGVYGMKIAGGFSVDPSTKISSLTHDPFAELERDESSEEDDESDDSDISDETNERHLELQKAQVPQNLKKLIRFIIQKHYIDNKNVPSNQKITWFVITEEEITSTWLKSFGFNIIDLNIAEKLINGSLSISNVLNGDISHADQDSNVREFYDPTNHRLDYLGRAQHKSNTNYHSPTFSNKVDENPMLFDPITGELVRADEFKGAKTAFRRLRGGNRGGRGGRGRGGKGRGRSRGSNKKDTVKENGNGKESGS